LAEVENWENISGESLRLGMAKHMSDSGIPESAIAAYMRRKVMMRLFSNQIEHARASLLERCVCW